MESVTEQSKKYLKKFEGLRLSPYRCPAGKWTIGYGHNLEARGLIYTEVQHILNHGGKLSVEEEEKIEYQRNGMVPDDVKTLLNGISPPEQMLSISKESAELILENDIKSCILQLETREYFLEAPEHIQIVLICLVFQCGLRGMEEKIRKRWGTYDLHGQLFITKLKRKEYDRAAGILVDSFLSDQTPRRTIELYKVMKGEGK